MDGNFLIRLGRTIKEAKTGLEPQFDKLDELLCRFWPPQRDRNWPGLYSFTDEALTEFCKLVLRCDNYSQDAIIKRRQRLCLKKPSKPTVVHVRRVNGRLIYDRK